MYFALLSHILLQYVHGLLRYCFKIIKDFNNSMIPYKYLRCSDTCIIRFTETLHYSYD